MGDLSSEPSMEEILSSIKRIIAEEGEATPGRGRRAGRAAPPVAADEEVLELSDPIPQDRPADAIRPDRARSPEPVRNAEPAAEPIVDAQPPEPEPVRERPRPQALRAHEPTVPVVETADATIVSSGTAEAARGALDQLSRLLVKPEPGADGTLEGLVRELLRPMLREWLDANLPNLVEGMVSREIERITSGHR